MKNNLAATLREFKPALRFLLVFASVYVVGNVLYGLYVEAFKPRPDPVTQWVTEQSAWLITIVSDPVVVKLSPDGPFVFIIKNNRNILNVYEGCSGLNVMIVFAAFVLAFGGKLKRVMGFIVSGCLLIHISNLIRILMLYLTAIHRPSFFYYFHKYFFTAVLYLIVFFLWFVWIEWMRRDSRHARVSS